jgi:hypothetical protein
MAYGRCAAELLSLCVGLRLPLAALLNFFSIITCRNRRIFQLAAYHDLQLDEIADCWCKSELKRADFDEVQKAN